MEFHRLQKIASVALSLIATPGYSEELTNRDAAIQSFADAVGTECTQEVAESLGLKKELCNQRHMASVAKCKIVAATDLPEGLSQKELGRAMLRFSFCRGMVIQGKVFDLTAWEPTITQMLEQANEAE